MSANNTRDLVPAARQGTRIPATASVLAIRPGASRLRRWRLPREWLAILGGLGSGLLFAEVFVWIFAKDTAASYEAYIGPSLERAGVPEEQITTTIEAGAARSISELLSRYEDFCNQNPVVATERRIDCKEIHRLRSQPVPHA